MNEQDREQVDSLIHGFLDGQLNERQQTELKRLAQHNPLIRKDLHALYRQKELLGALPVEKAPEGLKEEVLARLERRLILSSEPVVPASPIGRLHLVFRWAAAAAAMVMLPLAILGLLVLQIVKPPEPTSVPIAASGEGGTAEPMKARAPAVLGEETVLAAGSLSLLTDQPIAVNDSIKKAVVSHQLLSSASSERFEDHAVYRIQCRQEKMLSFLRSLEPVWNLCSKGRYVLSGDETTASKDIVVEGIRPEQMLDLLRHLERLNRRGLSDVALRVPSEEPGAEERTVLPAQPRLAWEKEQPGESAAAAEEGPIVVLVIEVRNLTEKK